MNAPSRECRASRFLGRVRGPFRVYRVICADDAPEYRTRTAVPYRRIPFQQKGVRAQRITSGRVYGGEELVDAFSYILSSQTKTQTALQKRHIVI